MVSCCHDCMGYIGPLYVLNDLGMLRWTQAGVVQEKTYCIVKDILHSVGRFVLAFTPVPGS